MSHAIVSPADVSRLRIPVFAIVPFSRHQAKTARQNKYDLLAYKHSGEMAVEAIRSLRTNLYFNLEEKDRNVVCVTGPSPTIGKSFISSNLAFLAARSGAKVLLVDGDMRRGNLGRYFGVQSKLPGLAQMLDGSCPPSSVKYEVNLETLSVKNKTSRLSAQPREVVATFDDTYCEERTLDIVLDTSTTHRVTDNKTLFNTPSITVVPRGETPENPSELLMQNRLPDFLEQASQDYDLVIVDTPPVLAATDATIIAKYADLNIMVLRQGDSTTHEAEEVVRSFANNKSRVNGIVLNGYDVQGGKYGKYGVQYGYRYSY